MSQAPRKKPTAKSASKKKTVKPKVNTKKPKVKTKKRTAKSRSVAESWSRITAWIKDNAPEFSFPLNNGAPESAIAAFERAIGSKLPADFRESVALHDGGGWFPPRYGDFLSLERILEEWKMYKSWQEKGDYADPEDDDWALEDSDAPIKPVFWNVKRIYITDNSGNHLTLDLDPPAHGKYGQVLHHSHEVGPTKVLASSWGEFLAKFAHDLESGKYAYSESEKELAPIEWLQAKPAPVAIVFRNGDE